MEGRGFGFVTFKDPQNAQQFLEVATSRICIRELSLFRVITLFVECEQHWVCWLTPSCVAAATRARNRWEEGRGEGSCPKELWK